MYQEVGTTAYHVPREFLNMINTNGHIFLSLNDNVHFYRLNLGFEAWTRYTF